MTQPGELVLKACACLVDARGHLLVFRHPGDESMQLPKGTVEPGETPHDAVRRELLEESGIRFDGPLESLGTLDRFCPAGGVEGTRIAHPQLWHLYLMRSVDALPETFEHVAIGSPQEHGLRFAFRWLAPDAPLDGFLLPYQQAIVRARAAV